jgi:hypothetical protein
MDVSTKIIEIETALGQIPGVRAARLVVDDQGKPVEVHIVAGGEKSPKQLVRDVQTVSMATFGVDLDHRIVSVVSFPEMAAADPGPPRPSIHEISTETRGKTSRVKIILTHGDLKVEGEATGVTSMEGLQRLAANAAMNAVRELLPDGTWLALEHTGITKVGSLDVAVATITLGGKGGPVSLSGSAVVQLQQTDAMARAVLDALNRQLWRSS